MLSNDTKTVVKIIFSANLILPKPIFSHYHSHTKIIPLLISSSSCPIGTKFRFQQLWKCK